MQIDCVMEKEKPPVSYSINSQKVYSPNISIRSLVLLL